MKKYLRFVFILLIIITVLLLISCKSDKSESTKTATGSVNETEEPAFLTYTGDGFPKPIGYVNDYAKILDEDSINKINTLVKDLERKTSAEVVVVSIETLGDKSLEVYSNQLFNSWGIGKKGKNNGVLFLISVNDRRIRIEVGIGLEKTITNDIAEKIIDEYIIPKFKESNFGEGTYQGIKKISEYILTIH